MEEIKQLDADCMPNHFYGSVDLFNNRYIPEPTSANMLELLNKINELVEAVNTLKKLNQNLIKSLNSNG